MQIKNLEFNIGARGLLGYTHHMISNPFQGVERKKPAPSRIPSSPGSKPMVFHVDMDAFFASVEMRSYPYLKHKPLVIGGGPGKRGVVTTASYPARKFGIRSGMAMAEALSRCPQLIVMPVNGSKYIHESLNVLSILDRFCPRVQPASIDEAYLEMDPCPEDEWMHRAHQIADEIRAVVSDERGITCTVGVGTNTLQAKMTSSLHKPNGTSVVDESLFKTIFYPKPVENIPGVGPKTTLALNRLGVNTVGQLASCSVDKLKKIFGSSASGLQANALGNTQRLVTTSEEESAAKSAGHETTFGLDQSNPEFIRATLLLLSDRVARRLRRSRVLARVVCVRFKIKKQRFSRQRTLAEPTDQAPVLARHCWDLLEKSRRGKPLRLVGVAGMKLSEGSGQAPCFAVERRNQTCINIGDALRDRFGENALLPGGVFLRRTGK